MGIQHDQRPDGQALLHGGRGSIAQIHHESVWRQLRRPDPEEQGVLLRELGTHPPRAGVERNHDRAVGEHARGHLHWRH